jgi:hypothetical protein
MLGAFYDWPRKEIALYQEIPVYDSTTGVVGVSYTLREIRSVWMYTAVAMKKYLTEKVINENQYVAVAEVSVTKTDLVYFDSEFYRITVDDVSFMGDVYLLALQRIDKPVYTGELPALNGGAVC